MSEPANVIQRLLLHPGTTLGVVVDPQHMCEDRLREWVIGAELREAARTAYSRGSLLIFAGRPGGVGFCAVVNERGQLLEVIAQANAAMDEAGSTRTAWITYTDAQTRQAIVEAFAESIAAEGTA